MSETISKEVLEPSKKDRVFTFVRILISILLLLLIVLKNYRNFQDIFSALLEINLLFILFAIFTHLFNIFTDSLRWNILLRAQGIRISTGFLYQSTFIGYFYNNLLPSNIGGDFYRIYDVHKNKDVPLSKSLSTVIIERFFGLICITVYFIITAFSLYSILRQSIVLISIFLAIAFLLFSIIIRPKFFRIDRLFRRFKRLEKVEKKIISFNDAINAYKNKWPYLALGLTINFISQSLFMVLFYFVSLSLGLNLNFMTFVFVVPIIFVLTGIPISIGGLGVRENTIVFLLTNFGVSNEQAVVFSFLILFEHLFTASLGGIVYFFKNIFYKSRGFI